LVIILILTTVYYYSTSDLHAKEDLASAITANRERLSALKSNSISTPSDLADLLFAKQQYRFALHAALDAVEFDAARDILIEVLIEQKLIYSELLTQLRARMALMSCFLACTVLYQ
jgi:hypothetical protein